MLVEYFAVKIEAQYKAYLFDEAILKLHFFFTVKWFALVFGVHGGFYRVSDVVNLDVVVSCFFKYTIVRFHDRRHSVYHYK